MKQRSDTSLVNRSSAFSAQRVLRFGALLLVLSLIAAACGGSSDTINLSEQGLSAPNPESSEVVVGDNFSEQVNFSYATFDGDIAEFADLNNQPVVLNFFASWCATCVAELPDFETVSQTFAGEVQFLGLSVQDSAELSADLIERTGVTFPTGLDQPGEIFVGFGGLGMPTTVFINADGSVADVHTGVLNEESLTAAINENFS